MSEEETEIEEEEDEPFGLASIIFGLVVAGLAAAYCYFTWARPDLLDSLFDADTSGRGARKVKFILMLIYNRVTGSIAGVFSLFCLAAIGMGFSEMKKGSDREDSEN